MAAVDRKTGRPSGKRAPGYARKSPADRRQELIAAAIRCLGEGGMSAFTIDRIRNEAGVSRGLINHYFGSKDDLLTSAYETMTDYLADASRVISAGNSASPLKQLTMLVEASFDPEAFDRSSLKAWLTLWGELSTNGQLQALHRKRYSAYRDGLIEAITAIAGDRQREVDARSLALALIALIDGLWLEWCIDPDVLSPDDARTACYQLIESKLGSIR